MKCPNCGAGVSVPKNALASYEAGSCDVACHRGHKLRFVIEEDGDEPRIVARFTPVGVGLRGFPPRIVSAATS